MATLVALEKYGAKDVGVIADGTFGDAYVSSRALAIAERYGMTVDPLALKYPEYEDAQLALQFLNQHAVEDGFAFVFEEGDLMFLPV